MTRWFRFYEDAVNDPKVQKLPGEKFKAWVNILCLASKNNGVLPCLDDLVFGLRVTRDVCVTLLDEFCDAGLIDPVEVRDAPMSYEPHNWKERQYITDTKDPTSAIRSKNYRDRKRDASRDGRDEAVSVTATRADTEAETEAETDKNTCAVAKATRPRYDQKFEEAWQAYPRRDGANPKAPSAKLFISSVKAGADPDEIIAGVVRYADAEHRNVGTPFIPQMVKWLRDKRWLDYDGTVVPIKFDVRKHLV